jgi:tetratricopeptide (TPR) repeat protein
MAQTAIGRMSASLGDYPRALDCFEKSLEIRKRVFDGDRPDIASSHFDLADILYHTGDYQAALEHGQNAYDMLGRLFEETNPEVVSAGVGLGEIFEAAGDIKNASVYYEKARAVHESNPDAENPGNVVKRLARTYITEGTLDVAEAILTGEKVRIKESGNRHSEAEMWLLAAELELARGDTEKARDYADKAIKVARELTVQPLLIDALIVKARVTDDHGICKQALDKAREIGDRPREAKALSTDESLKKIPS